MKSVTNLRQAVLCLLFIATFIVPQFSSAQCPSVMGTGDPAIILVNVYGIPHGQYVEGSSDRVEIGVTGGVQLGAIFSPGFQLMAGAEFSGMRNEVNTLVSGSGAGEVYNYKTSFLEVPLEMRMRFAHAKQSEAFFILGAGFMFANVKETNDPNITRDEMFFEQLFGRIGFEHTIEVKKTFNILWGLIGKADLIGLLNESASPFNGSYYGGLKVGIQIGL